MIKSIPRLPTKTLHLAITLLSCLVMSEVADAAVITLKDGTRFGCWIIEKGETEVIVEVVEKSGQRTRKTIKIGEVTSVDYAVSASRLAKLAPAEPLLYKEYAEELADVTIDPEARPMSLRLYQIALNLAPDQFGESCLLGMIRIARNRKEERKFRAAAFVHLQNQDDSLISPAGQVSAGPEKEVDHEALLKLLREIRSRKRTVIRDNEVSAVRQALSPFADSFSDEKLAGLLTFECVNCQNGKIDCPYCERGFVVSRNRRTKCTQCQRGKTTCAVCDASTGKPALPEDLAARIVSAEIRLLSEKLEAGTSAVAAPEDSPQAWSQIRESAQKRTIPALNLSNLTEFDPRKSLFRKGEWVQPPSDE